MKVILRFFAIIALFVITPGLSAQANMDISLGFGFGDQGAGRLSLNFVLENRLTLSGFYHGYIEKIAILGLGDNRSTSVVGGMVGYASDLGRTSRFSIRGGIGLATTSTTHLSFSGNKDTESSTHLGVAVDPRFEFLLSRVFGLGIGGYAVFAGGKSFYGISLDFMLGKLRD